MHTPVKIIIIDDEEKMTTLLRLIIEDHMEAEVETFNDPVAALNELQLREYDVISLDHRMPGMTGMMLAKRLRYDANGPNATTPILIFTGFREEAEILAIDLLDNLLFLEKPIEDERYIHNVKIALAMKSKIE